MWQASLQQTHDALRSCGVRLIDTAAGSACSLVANLFHEQLHSAPPELCALLFATIAVDTRGFDAKELKYSAADVVAGQRLLAALGGDGRGMRV